jgi:hypothetical protein
MTPAEFMIISPDKDEIDPEFGTSQKRIQQVDARGSEKPGAR